MFALPKIKTQVAEVAAPDALDTIDRSSVRSAAGEAGSEDFGVLMDLNEIEIQPTRGEGAGGRPLPKNFQELHLVIDRVKPGTTGSNNKFFKGGELYQIARNLGLQAVNNKAAQAQIIIDAHDQLYGHKD